MHVSRVKFQHLVLVIDLMGTALFAAEGAIAGILGHLDLLGVLVVAFCTALGGGILRDILLGALPPNAMRKWIYPTTALSAGLLIFLLPISTSAAHAFVMTVLDAAGLSFCAVAGATKALEFDMHPLHAILLGGISGVGGGTIRDLLLNRVPYVLHADVYATAALFGSAIAIILMKLKVRPQIASPAGIAASFALRMVAVTYHWNLPIARS
jgi:uncharacterized membrane protein YeiH